MAKKDGEEWDFSGLTALYFNCTLTKSPGKSHTDLLIDTSKKIMEKNGVKTEVIRVIDQEANILVVAGPIWLGDNSSQTKKIIERLYSSSSSLNDKGQYAFYGKVGGCLITGNEDGIKHCAQNVLYSLQHVGYTIPPQADAGWIGEAGPGPSYGDKLKNGSVAGVDNDFTQRNTTFMTWNLMHLAKMLKSNGGIPAHGNQRSEWDAGCRFDFENPEHR
jgi:multimeric flavodoxin WrbA